MLHNIQRTIEEDTTKREAYNTRNNGRSLEKSAHRHTSRRARRHTSDRSVDNSSKGIEPLSETLRTRPRKCGA